MVTFIITFTVTGDTGEFERIFEEHMTYMRRHPGFRGNQLVRSLRRPNVYVNVAQWESPEIYRQVVEGEEFKRQTKNLSALVEAQGDLYRPVAATVAADSGGTGE